MKVKTTMEPDREIEVDGAAYRRLKAQGLIHEEPKAPKLNKSEQQEIEKGAQAFLPTEPPAPASIEAQASDKKVGA